MALRHTQGNLSIPPAGQGWLEGFYFFQPQNEYKLAVIPCPTVSN